jgi:uncharacterized membrane protein
MIKDKNEKERLLHMTFVVSIILKGLDGIMEMLGGVLLFLANQSKIQHFVIWITQHELAEDPRDLVANYLLNFGKDLSISDKNFGALYLLSHGIVKVVLITALIKKRLWAYPALIIFLFLFIVYQLYRYSYSHSFYLTILSLFDLLIIVLTAWEYQRLRKGKLAQKV